MDLHNQTIFSEKMLKKKVSFDLSQIQYWYEPVEQSKALHEARKSDFLQRQADKMRMEHLLNPILSTSHRQKIFQKLNS